MPQFEVRAPFAGYVRIKIEAESTEQAIENALSAEFDLAECVENYRVVKTLGRGFATAEMVDDVPEQRRAPTSAAPTAGEV